MGDQSMKMNLFILKFLSVSLAFILVQGISYAMPGMHGSGSGAATGASTGIEQSRRENQFDRIGDGDYLQR